MRFIVNCLSVITVAFFYFFQGAATTAQTLNTIIDNETGIRVAIPLGMVSKRSNAGRNWHSSDGLNIDSLKFEDRSLSEFYNKLRNVSGRHVTNSVPPGNSFLLEGIDRDGSAFSVRASASGGQIRGLSVVYRSASSSVARAIINSFEAFPTAAADLDRRRVPQQNEHSVTPIVDSSTGVRLVIPVALQGRAEAADWGRNWRTADRRFNIDTLKFDDRTLRELYNKFRNKDGRIVTKDVFNGNHFILEGTDRDRSIFYIEAHERGSEIRGLSIVYSGNGLASLAESIKQSFEPFPYAIVRPVPPVHVPQPPRQDAALAQKIEDLQQQIRELESKLSVTSQDQAAKNDLRKTIDDLRHQIEIDKQIISAQSSDGEPAALPGRRVAFVLGIDNYKNFGETNQLKNAYNDALSISQTLNSIGFTVVEARDLSRTEFNFKWQQFLNQIDSESFVAFFFAGHGVQMDGVNLLLPSDVPLVSTMQQGVLKREAINLNDLMTDLREKKPKLSLLILDACRNNPYAESTGRGGSPSSRGLAPVEKAKGTFVMYSADAGEIALDRLPDDPPEERNSVYTRKLVPLLRTPNLSVQQVAQRVRADVQRLADLHGYTQTPAYYDGVVGLVCLTGNCARTSAK